MRVRHDLAYGPHSLQRMDVYLPPAGASAGGAAPLIVMAHGGGWRRGDKAMAGVTQDKVARWVAAGAVLVSLNYRVLPAADPRQQAVDVATAIATAQQRAPGWGADSHRMVLMGYSTGAHLMALVASSTAVRAQAGLPLQPWLGAVLLDSATLDLPMTLQHRQTRGRRGAGPLGRLHDDAFGDDPSRWPAVSPWHQLDAAPPPVLIVCAVSRADACGQARHYAARVQALGGLASVLPVALSHGEINAQLGRSGRLHRCGGSLFRRIGAWPR